MSAPAPRPAANFAVLSAGEIGARLLTFVAMIVLTRGLGVAGFGLLAFGLATVAYVELAVGFGLGILGQLEVARGKTPVRNLIGAIVTIRLAMVVVAFVALAVVLRWAPLSDPARSVTLLFGIVILPRAIQLDWALLGAEQMAPVARSQVLAESFLALGVVALVRSPDDLLRVPLIYLTARAVLVVLQGHSAWLRFGFPRALPDPRLARRLFREAAPVAATIGCGHLYYTFDLVLLGVVAGAEASGLYGASHRLFLLLLILTHAYAVSLRPALGWASERGYARVEPLVESSLRLTVAAAVGVAAGGSILARPILVFLFGPAFGAGAPALALLCLGFVLHVANRQYRDLLVAFRHQRTELRVVAAGAALNVPLALLLASSHGAVGAAAATLVAEALVLVLSIRAARQRVSLTLPRLPWARAVLCGLVLAAFVYVIDGPHVLLRIALGAALYVGLCLATGVARPRDVRRLLGLAGA
ncbi:MAG: oligosaccharide flippase family protein [Gemmatimonadota bacterium]